MGDSQNAADALAQHPRWVAVHENTLAKLDVAVAVFGSYGHDVDVVLAEMDEARKERDRAVLSAASPDPAGAADRSLRQRIEALCDAAPRMEYATGLSGSAWAVNVEDLRDAIEAETRGRDGMTDYERRVQAAATAETKRLRSAGERP